MKTLQKVKDEVAASYGMEWDRVIQDRSLFDATVEIVAKKYAEQQSIEFGEFINKTGVRYWGRKWIIPGDHLTGAERIKTTKQLYQELKKGQS